MLNGRPKLRAFFLQVMLGFFIALIILGFEGTTTSAVTANQISTTSAMPLLSTDFLDPFSSATTSARPSFPITTQLEQSLKATPIASPEADFCLNVPVIMYHHVQPLQIADLLGHAPLTVDSDIFETQIKYLTENGYNAISSDQLINALLTHQQLPEKSVMITLDDGYDDAYTYAFLMAKKYHFVMNFMIITGLTGKPGYMNWDHLKEMAIDPYARLYNHTETHQPLGLINKDQIVAEITKANQDLQTKLGLNNTILTYPYGSYSDEAISTAKELGMKGAFTTDPGREQCVSTIMKLPRVRVGNAPISDYGF